MNKEFCTYEQALALKELGFDESCLAIYTHNNSFYSSGTFFLHHPHPFTIEELTPIVQDVRESYVYILAPLKQQVFRFFREKYGLYSWITMELGNKSTFCWVLSGEHTSTQYAAYFKTYEEAESALIDKLIELIKNIK